MTAPKYAVGQTVWVVLNQGKRDGWAASVTKVGRKWVTLAHGTRFDASDGCIDGGRYSPPGKVYASQDAYAAERALSAAWWSLGEELRNTYSRAQPGVTLERIAEARRLLGLEVTT